MARLFDDAASDKLEFDVAPLTTTPFSMGCWFNPDVTTKSMTLMSISDKDATNQQHALIADGATLLSAGDPVVAASRGVTFGFASTSTAFSASVWQHALGVWGSATDRRVYLNGGGKGTNASNKTATNLDRISIGVLGDSSPSNFMDGLIADAALWNVSLSDDDAAALAAGVSPLLIRPDALVAYWPLIGAYSPEIDEVGAFPLTLTGTAQADHPPIIYPSGIIDVIKATGGAAFPQHVLDVRRRRRRRLEQVL